MDHPKLLIADGNDEFRQALAHALTDGYIIRTCRSGRQALELLRTFRPDILVLDLMLPEIDGLNLLQKVSAEGLRPVTLAVSSLKSDYITSALGRLGVEYMVIKPCQISAVTCLVSDMTAQFQPQQSITTPSDPQSLASDMLLSLGLSSKVDGFRYLQIAVPLFAQDPKQAITKELYAAVSKVYGKHPKLVERSIRSAIDKAWLRRSDLQWQLYFQSAPDGQVPRPSNGMFISRLAHELTKKISQSA